MVEKYTTNQLIDEYIKEHNLKKSDVDREDIRFIVHQMSYRVKKTREWMNANKRYRNTSSACPYWV